MPAQTFVIVGASLAGAKAAETLRDEGFDGRVVLLGSESERPYERPPLSKDYLRGEADEKPYVHPADFYAEHEIELRTDTEVERIDPGAAEVSLAGGETLAFDKLLLATGAEPRRLALPGAELDGVLVPALARGLRGDPRAHRRGRHPGDDRRWLDRRRGRGLRPPEGLRGHDPRHGAAAARARPGPRARRDLPRRPQRPRGERSSAALTIEAIEGTDRVTGVRLAGDRRIDADAVLVGVGVEPRVELAKAAGLEIDNGVLVDEHLQTSAPGVFAAGDVANALHPLYGGRIRVEHWANALEQGPAAARNMLGRGAPYDRVPYFFSDQYDVGMEYAGHATDWDEVVFRGDPAGREFIAFWLKGDAVVAGMNVNIWDVNEHLQALARARRPVDRGRLADPDVPLEELLAPD